MSKEELQITGRKPGRLKRMLQRLGFISSEQRQVLEEEQQRDPSVKTDDFLVRQGWVSEDQIRQADETSSGDLSMPMPAPMVELRSQMRTRPTTGEILTHQFKEARQSSREAAMQSVFLRDVASRIAKKSGPE